MRCSVQPPTIELRGDDRYNPRPAHVGCRLDGATIITGVMRPDSPKGAEANPPLPELPFRYTIPADATHADYCWRINPETWRRLQANETLWDLDFTPQPPPSPPESFNAGGLLLAGTLLLGLLALNTD